MEDVEQVGRDALAVLGDARLVDVPLQCGDELVAVLFDHEPHELLHTHQLAPTRVDERTCTCLCDVEVRLHDEERVQSICPGRIGVIKKVLDLRKRRLAEPRPTILGRERLGVCVLQTQRFRGVCKRSYNARMQCLHLLEAGGEELPLWGRTFVHAYPYKNLTQ